MAVPAIPAALGINIVDPVLGQLIAGFLAFTAVIQIVAARDLFSYGWAVFWEGALRWVAASLLIPHGFFGHMGVMAGVLGIADFLVGSVFLIVLPRVIGKPRSELIAGR